MAEVRVYRDAEVLALEAARLLAEEIRVHLRRHGRTAVVLAGGSTPRRTYSELAGLLEADPLPEGRVVWVPGDERWVGPEEPESNERMIRDALGDASGAGAHLLSWGAGGPAAQAPAAAERFGRRLQEELPAGRSCFGPAVLGLGADGHTASLFPDGQAVSTDGARRPVSPGLPGPTAAVHRPGPDAWRLTLTPAFLRRACRIFFLVSGARKRETLRRVLDGVPGLPAAWFDREDTLFLVTRDAVDEVRIAG